MRADRNRFSCYCEENSFDNKIILSWGVISETKVLHRMSFMGSIVSDLYTSKFGGDPMKTVAWLSLFKKKTIENIFVYYIVWSRGIFKKSKIIFLFMCISDKTQILMGDF